jgi:hypothetical protein
MFTIPEAEIDFTNIRHYHPEIEFIANSVRKSGQPINAIQQPLKIDVDESEWTAFIENYERIFIANDISDEHSLPLWFLVQQTYSDIEQGEAQLAQHGNMLNNLNFLKEILSYQESKPDKDGLPELSLSIEHKRRTATLNDPAIATFMIKQLIKIFKDKSYNFALAGMLENIELTAANVKREIDKYTYRNTDIPHYCTAQTADRIRQYLNAHTTFTRPGKNLTNEQARFIYGILELFNLTPYLLKRKTVPRIAKDIPAFKTQIIKDLVKNHKLYRK